MTSDIDKLLDIEAPQTSSKTRHPKPHPRKAKSKRDELRTHNRNQRARDKALRQDRARRQEELNFGVSSHRYAYTGPTGRDFRRWSRQRWNPKPNPALRKIKAAAKIRAHSALSSGLLGPFKSSLRGSTQPRSRPFMGLTQNGAPTLTTSGDPLVDFFFQILPNTALADVHGYLDAAWDEDPLSAMRLVFHLRDIREGKGDREQFYECLDWIAENHPRTLLANMEWFPTFGYWKDLLMFVLRQLEGVEARVARSKELEKIAKRRQENNERITQHRILRYLKTGPDFSKVLIAKKRQQRHNVVDMATKKTRAQANIEKNLAEGRALKQQAHERRERERAERAELIVKKMENDEFFRQFYDRVVELFAEQLSVDAQKLDEEEKRADLTLCAKWAPRLGGSFDRRAHLGRAIAIKMFADSNLATVNENEEDVKLSPDDTSRVSAKEISIRIACERYRKEVCVPLRRALECPEIAMSARRWNEVNYERTPSVCMATNARHFVYQDKKRFQQYLTDVANGTKKIAAGAVMPHDLLRACEMSNNTVADLQFQSIIRKLRETGTFSNSIAVCDVSGSMSGIPMDVAVALSMILADLNTGEWHNEMITFSEQPCWFKVPDGTLHDKIRACKAMPWGCSTNYYRVFSLIRQRAIDRGVAPADMIRRLYVFSDMEFNTSGGRTFETTHEQIKREYVEAGFEMPQIVFWNLRSGDSKAVPASSSDKGVALVSGYNASLLKIFMDGSDADWVMDSGGNAKEVLDAVLNSDRYVCVDKIVD